jgi:hypothetical protein
VACVVGPVVGTVSIFIKMTIGFCAWSGRHGRMKHVTMRVL